MSKIEFSVEISPEKKRVALAAMSLIAAMAEVTLDDLAYPGVVLRSQEEADAEVKNVEVNSPEVVKPEAEKTEEEAPKKKRASKKATAKKAEPETEEEETTEAEEAEEKAPLKVVKTKETAETLVTVEDIRAIMKDVVRDHREAIKAKLTEFGASSASTLDEDHFDAFYGYLGSLKK